VVEATHVQLDLTLEIGGDTAIQHIETWLVTEPYYWVVKRLEREGDGEDGGKVTLTTALPPSDP